jgi:hypothetical protein
MVADSSVRDRAGGEDLPVRLGPRRRMAGVERETVGLCECIDERRSS